MQGNFFEAFSQDLMVDKSRAAALGFSTATADDLDKLTQQKRQVLHLLKGRWMTAKLLVQYTGATEAVRRARELRSEGWEILSRGSGRFFEYHWTGRRKA